MFYRLERIVEPCLGMGYTYYTKHLRNLGGCLNWDHKVGLPLQSLECPLGFKKAYAPVTWKHPRPAHIRDPFLREVTIEYCKKGLEEHNNLRFGCQTIEQLNIWFPESIREIMINEFGFGLKKYVAKLVWHGLRQSMLDVRSVVRVYETK